MKEDLDIVSGLWIGGSLSAMEKACIRSFQRQGHEYHLYTYGSVEGVPEGVHLHDAAAVLPESRIFRYPKSGGLGGFANLFRYHLLVETGGWWADMDFICLQPLTAPSPLYLASEGMKSGKGRHVNNCVIHCEPGDAFVKKARDIAEKKDPTKLRHGETGPKLLHNLANRWKRWRDVANWTVFCPVHYWQADRFFGSARTFRVPDDTVAIHFWNEIWRQRGLDKTSLGPEDCLYRALLAEGEVQQ